MRKTASALAALDAWNRAVWMFRANESVECREAYFIYADAVAALPAIFPATPSMVACGG